MRPQNTFEFVGPRALLGGEPFLQAVEDHLVCGFGLTVPLGVSWCIFAKTDSPLIAKTLEMGRYELQAVVCNDFVWDPVAT